MRAVRWLVTLAVLPFIWCEFELQITHKRITEKPKHVSPEIFNLRQDPGHFELNSPDYVGRVALRSTPQETFQVAQPILTEHGLRLRGQSNAGEPAPKASCSKLLMVHSFSNSYYKPFVS